MIFAVVFVSGSPYFPKKLNLFQSDAKTLANLLYLTPTLTLKCNPSPNPNRNLHIKNARMNIAHCIFSLF